jgi:ABC-type multidrug transport system fused ATPase/permease subunit
VVLHLPTTFFSDKGVTDATSRFVQDTNELARGQNTLLGKTMVEPAKALGSIAVAVYWSWELTLMALVAGPPAFFLVRRFGKKMHNASKRALENWSSMLAVLGETLLGIRVVKSYTMEGSERRRFFRVNRDLVRQQMKKERLDAATGPVVEALGISAGMVAAAVAGYMVFVGYSWHGDRLPMDRSVFLAWMVALFAMFDPVRKLAKVWMRFHESDAAARRIFDLQDTPQEPHVLNAPSLPRHAASIEFRDVSFRYPAGSQDVLQHVDLDIRAGQTIAIVGPNGSGKTTLLSLVPRLIDPDSGAVYVDGHDISKVSVRSLRRQIGLVTQDTILFNATIAENIAYGLRRPRPGAVLAAARQAYVDEFVSDKARFPDGYETMVGEYGATLSGGQKQRIAIARAILRDPAILIFDEAMSQVDSESERRIHQAMETFVKGRTTLLIAHRFATVLSADRIAVMKDGRIIDFGTHKELLDRCEPYNHLYRTQFVDTGG